MKYKIQTFSATFNGVRLGVKIVNGRGETDDISIAKQAKERGYIVTPDPDKPVKKKAASK